MIPVLRSINGLLNRFDELSQRHAHFISNFEKNFTDTENPLHDVARDEAEQRKTAENLLMKKTESNDQVGSVATIETFNRRITKNRCHHRPPSYSSNDTNSFLNRVPSGSSWATAESVPPLLNSTSTVTKSTIKPSISQSMTSNSTNNFVEPKIPSTTKIKPKVLPQNSPTTTHRYARGTITAFTMETVNRLSKPKKHYQISDQKVSPKRTRQPAKTCQNKEREGSEPSILSVSSQQSSQTKRTNMTTIKSASKKLKADSKLITESVKRIPMSNYPRPVIFLAAPPTISLTFPMQPEIQSSRVVVLPKTMKPKKPISIYTNKKPIMPTNRMTHLIE